MDGHKFDDLARRLAVGTDRRSVLKRLAAGAAAGALGLAGRGAGAAPRKKASSQKVAICHATGSKTNPYVLIQVSANATKQGHGGHEGDIIPAPKDQSGKPYCPGAGGCKDDNECGTGKTCKDGVCECGAGSKPCGDACIPEKDCCTGGQPGCPDGKECDPAGSGTCKPKPPTCGTGQKPCGTTCIAQDVCCTEGQPGCAPGFHCDGGSCVPDSEDGTCPAGSELECCYAAVRRACRRQGGGRPGNGLGGRVCRRRGRRACNGFFGAPAA